MDPLETVAETASQLIELGDCTDLFVSCITVGFLLAAIPFLVGMAVSVMIRIFHKA